jgi:hypothetical protein
MLDFTVPPPLIKTVSKRINLMIDLPEEDQTKIMCWQRAIRHQF